MPKPPFWVRVIWKLLLDPQDRSDLAEELGESYARRAEREETRAARAWIERQYRRSVVPLLVYRIRGVNDHPHAERGGTGGATMGALTSELRFSLRRLASSPGFTLTVLATVGLGIGGSTGAFSIVHAVVIKPLPYEEPERLVRIYTDVNPGEWGLSVADYIALEEQQTHFSSVALMRSTGMTLETDAGARRVRVSRVTPSLFRTLGIGVHRGRTITEEDVAEEAAAVVILGHGYWGSEFGADPGVIGRKIRLEGNPFTVVGVLNPGGGPVETASDMLIPYRIVIPPRKGPFGRLAIGRLRPGAGRAAAEAELRAINDRIFPLWQDSWPREDATWRMEDLKEYFLGESSTALLVLMAAVGLVLLIASMNAASLLVARGARRKHEIAVRTALGASKGRLLGHLLTESALLALTGSGLGLAITFGTIRAAHALGGGFLVRVEEIGFTPPVVAFLAAVTAGSLLLFGLIPALGLVRDPEAGVLRTGVRGGSSPGIRRFREALVAAQFAVTLPLAIGGALLLGTLQNLHRVDPGFEPEGLLTAELRLPAGLAETSGELRAAWEPVEREVRAIPGVRSVGLGNGRPPTDPAFGNNFVLEDRPLAPGEGQPSVPWVIAAPEYFEALSVPLVAGRMFDADAEQDARIAIVDESWAVRFFGGAENAVGRRFRHGGCTSEGCPWWSVIGVVGDVKYTGLDSEGEGTMYLDFDQYPQRSAFLFIRTDVTPTSIMPAVRRIVKRERPGSPITEVATGEELLRDSLRKSRYLTVLVGAFAVVGLALSVIGIYGVMAYFVHHHRRDIGIRIALGAGPSRAARLVVTRGLRLVLLGASAGLLAALGISRLIASLLFQMQAKDPATVAGVTALVLVTAALACAIPARSAAKTNPATMLREE